MLTQETASVHLASLVTVNLFICHTADSHRRCVGYIGNEIAMPRTTNFCTKKQPEIENAMIKKLLGAIAVLALPLAACATEYRIVDRPRQQCWNEQVPVQSARSDYGGAIVGGIAGGLLGNQIGGGNGKTVATAVGAMTGAMVGDRMSAAGPSYRSYQTVQRCRTVMDRVRVPVYYEPAAMVYAPMPIVEERIYYTERAQPAYREQWPRERWQRKHRKHGKHEHEDDDEHDRGHGSGKNDRHHGDDDDDDD